MGLFTRMRPPLDFSRKPRILDAFTDECIFAAWRGAKGLEAAIQTGRRLGRSEAEPHSKF